VLPPPLPAALPLRNWQQRTPPTRRPTVVLILRPSASPCRRERSRRRGTRRRRPSTSGASTRPRRRSTTRRTAWRESLPTSPRPTGAGTGTGGCSRVRGGCARRRSPGRSSAWPRLRQRHQLDVPVDGGLPRALRVRLLRRGPRGPRRSHGLRAFVPDLDAAVGRPPRLLPRGPGAGGARVPVLHFGFLFGESMGGAICLLVHLRTPPEEWAGAVLVAPMCRISDRIRPPWPWPLPKILTFVTRFAPTAPIVPTADLIEKSVKVAAKRVIAARNLQWPAEARHRSRAAARHRRAGRAARQGYHPVPRRARTAARTRWPIPMSAAPCTRPRPARTRSSRYMMGCSTPSSSGSRRRTSSASVATSSPGSTRYARRVQRPDNRG
jgi:hypothetical protein